MSRKVWIPLVVFAFALACLWPDVAPAGYPSYKSRAYQRERARRAAARRQKMINATRAEIAAARQVLAEAESDAGQAQGKIDSANGVLEGNRSAIELARSSYQNSHSAMRGIETELLESAGDTSEVGRAKADYEAAFEAYTAEQRRILDSSEYKQRMAKAEFSPDRKELLPELRREFFESDADYQQALAKMQSIKSRFDKLRLELFHKSPEWTAASEAIKDAHLQETAANDDATRAGLRKLPAKRDLREAQRVAENARLTIAQGEAILRSLGVKNRPKPTGPSYASPKKE